MRRFSVTSVREVSVDFQQHTTSVLFNSLVFNDKKVKEQIEKKTTTTTTKEKTESIHIELFLFDCQRSKCI